MPLVTLLFQSLLQVGAQDVAMGVKFSAACTLEIHEYPAGIPEGLCAVDGNWDYYFPQPWGGSSSNDSADASTSSSSSMEVDVWRDISFAAVEGDFQVRLLDDWPCLEQARVAVWLFFVTRDCSWR
jgi:hypothetical protein